MISTLHSIDTVYSADSVEWCPHEPHHDLFVCGTYQLEDASQVDEGQSQFDTKCKRKGRIYFFRFDATAESLIEVFQVETNAILDQKWHPKEILLATADSKGIITLYRLEHNRLSPVTELKLESEDDDLLALSLDWKNDGTKLIVSDSKGGVNIINVADSHLQLIHNQPSVHSFEAWTCIFDRHDSHIFYTGGDDTFLNSYDTRLDLTSPTFKWRNKSHGAGVTSLLSCSHLENALITGSYDETLRYFDTRQPKSSVFEIFLGGGIWRIKQHLKSANELLTANMYHNFTVVRVEQGMDKFSIAASYFEHKSICYGVDWCPRDTRTGCKYFASCSFYDHKLCVAKYEK